jgi:hypothetical protein
MDGRLRLCLAVYHLLHRRRTPLGYAMTVYCKDKRTDLNDRHCLLRHIHSIRTEQRLHCAECATGRSFAENGLPQVAARGGRKASVKMVTPLRPGSGVELAAVLLRAMLEASAGRVSLSRLFRAYNDAANALGLPATSPGGLAKRLRSRGCSTLITRAGQVITASTGTRRFVSSSMPQPCGKSAR